MPLQNDAFDAKRLGSAALFGFAAASLNAPLFTSSPGMIFGFVFGLIPFEGEAIAAYLAIASVFNFVFYTCCFYCGALIWTRMRTNHA